MQLILNFIDEGFNKYLVDKMYFWMSSNLNPEKLNQLQLFVNSDPIFKSIYIKHIDLKEICYVAIQTLRFDIYRSANRVKVTVNPDLKIYGLDTIRIIDIVNLINYGNLFVKPYPIFSEMFGYFNNHIYDIYNMYILGV